MGLTENSYPNKRPWSPFHLGLISYFCIILPGGLLFAENFERLGKAGWKLGVQLLTLFWFFLMMASIAWLPANLTWISELVHLIFPVGMIFLQNPSYQKWREETEDMVPKASLSKPILASVLFALFLFSAIVAKDWYLRHRLEKRMSQAAEAYTQGQYEQSTRILRSLQHDYPDERTVYVNLALSHEAVGQRDSAIQVFRTWLERSPGDEEVSEMLYKLRYASGSE